MKRSIFYLLSALVVLTMLLSACAAPATEAPKLTEPAALTQGPEPTKPPEPTAEPESTEPPAPAMATPEDLDEAFAAMLDTMVAYNTVSAEDLMAEMAEDEPPFLLDVRTTEEVEEQGHIEGAAHIPLDELAQHIDLLPAFNTPIVTYCAGGWRATIGMTALHALGWTDVRALKVAFMDWVDAGNPVAEGLPEPLVLDGAQPDAVAVSVVDTALSTFAVKPYGIINPEGLNIALVENPDLVLMDVRRLEEVEENGVINTGGEAPIHIPLEDFITSMDQWPADPAASIAVYCGSGHRSTMAMTILWLYGYSDVSSLLGGFASWVEADYPVAEYVTP